MESFWTNAHKVGEDLVRAFYELFCLRFCVLSVNWKNTVQQRFYKEFRRQIYMKIIITIISKNLATNLFYLLFSVRRNQEQELDFQRYAKINRLLWKDFLTWYSFSYHSSMPLLWQFYPKNSLIVSIIFIYAIT